MTSASLQLLTATGDRHEAFALCQAYMQRQDFKGPVHWHVVDDGNLASDVKFQRAGWSVFVHRLAPMAGNSQHRNTLHGLQSIDPSVPLVIVEDDDWYAPDWLTRCALDLTKADLVGETHARYYNVRDRKGMQLHNHDRASLCSTAMAGAAIDAFRAATLSGDKWIDMRLWQTWPGSKSLMTGHSVVGIKGMPGRGGIGCGHDPNFSAPLDPSLGKLREWIGNDAGLYEQFWVKP